MGHIVQFFNFCVIKRLNTEYFIFLYCFFLTLLILACLVIHYWIMFFICVLFAHCFRFNASNFVLFGLFGIWIDNFCSFVREILLIVIVFGVLKKLPIIFRVVLVHVVDCSGRWCLTLFLPFLAVLFPELLHLLLLNKLLLLIVPAQHLLL